MQQWDDGRLRAMTVDEKQKYRDQEEGGKEEGHSRVKCRDVWCLGWWGRCWSYMRILSLIGGVHSDSHHTRSALRNGSCGISGAAGSRERPVLVNVATDCLIGLPFGQKPTQLNVAGVNGRCRQWPVMRYHQLLGSQWQLQMVILARIDRVGRAGESTRR